MSLAGLRFNACSTWLDVGTSIANLRPAGRRAAARDSGPHFPLVSWWCWACLWIPFMKSFSSAIYHLPAERSRPTSPRRSPPASYSSVFRRRLQRPPVRCVARYGDSSSGFLLPAQSSSWANKASGGGLTPVYAVALDRDKSIFSTRGIAVRDLHVRALHREHDDSARRPGENRGLTYGAPAAGDSGRDKGREKFEVGLSVLLVIQLGRCSDRVRVMTALNVRRGGMRRVAPFSRHLPPGPPASPRGPSSLRSGLMISDRLFSDVQASGIFPDSQGIRRCRPRSAPATIEGAATTRHAAPRGFVLPRVRGPEFRLRRPAGDAITPGLPEHGRSHQCRCGRC